MVTKGSMTAAQVVVELDRLLPSYKGAWIVEEKGQNMFTTMFPSSDELHRMVLWGPNDLVSYGVRTHLDRRSGDHVGAAIRSF